MKMCISVWCNPHILTSFSLPTDLETREPIGSLFEYATIGYQGNFLIAQILPGSQVCELRKVRQKKENTSVLNQTSPTMIISIALLCSKSYFKIRNSL